MRCDVMDREASGHGGYLDASFIGISYVVVLIGDSGIRVSESQSQGR